MVESIKYEGITCPECESTWFYWEEDKPLPEHRVTHVLCSCGNGYDIIYVDETNSIIIAEDEVQ